MYSLCLILACWSADSRPAPIAPDYLLDSDPLLPDIEVTKAFSPLYLPLWLQALDRP